MKQQLSGPLQDVATQFVYLPIDLNEDTQNASAWSRLHPRTGGGIPHVQVVTFDGKAIHDKPGSVGREDLVGYLKQTGPFLNERQIAEVAAALEAAKQALEAEDITKAMLALTPVMKYSAAPGEVVQQTKDFVASLGELGREKLASAEPKLASAETALEGAIDILDVQTDYRQLKEVATEAQQLMAKSIRENTELRGVFDQAKLFQAAERQAAFKNLRAAQTTYEGIIRRFPNTPAAVLAEQKLAEIK